ncbi:hypothetical protein Hanom_Chr13g01185931 [Helianthus anomalus]
MTIKLKSKGTKFKRFEFWIKVTKVTKPQGSFWKFTLVFIFQQDTLCDYLNIQSHPNAISLKGADPIRMEMSWRTLHNVTHCGIFVMRHMESYFGDACSNLKCGLSVESEAQRPELNDLRHKYVAKILPSDVNTSKEIVAYEIKRFEKMGAYEKRILKEERQEGHVD